MRVIHVKEIIFAVFLLAFSSFCLAQDWRIDAQTKEVCNQVIKNVFEDISKVKNKYKELEDFGSSALRSDGYEGLSGIFYSHDITALRKDKESQLGDNPFTFFVQIAPIDAQFQAVNIFEHLAYPRLSIKLYGSFIKADNVAGEIYQIIEKNSKFIFELEQRRSPLKFTISSEKQVYEIGEKIILSAALDNQSEKEMIIFWSNKEPSLRSTGAVVVFNTSVSPEDVETLYIKPKNSLKKEVVVNSESEFFSRRSKQGKIRLMLKYIYPNIILNFETSPNQEIVDQPFISNTIAIEVIETKSNAVKNECAKDGYIEYKPIYLDTTARSYDEVFVVDESKLDAGHLENVKFVLDFYKIEHKMVDDRIMINCKLWKDKDSLANITKKANDKNWLEMHGK